MSKSLEALASLLEGRQVWRGTTPVTRPAAGQSTGLQALDDLLPGGGWPASGLVEVLHEEHGQGELSLLLPVLAGLTRRARPVLLISPPYQAYAPAWQGAGVQLSRLHVLTSEATGGLWAMEQALRAGCCGAVLGWLPVLEDKTLRRLQLAAETGQTIGFLLRKSSPDATSSTAALRLRVEGGRWGSEIRILKCRGRNPPGSTLHLRDRTLH